MFDLEVFALKFGDNDPFVVLSAELPDPCYSACVTGFYPGGNLEFVEDPGHAVIHLQYRESGDPCADVITPWSTQVVIPGGGVYDKVLVQETNVLADGTSTVATSTHPIVELTDCFPDPAQDDARLARAQSTIPTHEYIVIALTVAPTQGCRTIRADMFYPGIYSRVFGPASQKECEAYIADNCIG